MFLLLHSVWSFLVIGKSRALTALATNIHGVAEVPTLRAVAHVVFILRASGR